MHLHPTLSEPRICAILDQDYPRIRSCTIATDPTPLYRGLNRTANTAFDAVAAVLKAGVQVGELVRITRDGCISIHTTTREFMRLEG